MRELVRDGTLAAGSRLPSSRALADDLGVSRRLVVEAYAQLLAEGYLVARHGAGTYVAVTPGARWTASPRRLQRAHAALRLLPRQPRSGRVSAGAVAARDARRAALGADRARSPTPIRAARSSCAARSPSTCGACAASSSSRDTIVVCAGAAQGLALLGRALSAAASARSPSRTRACRAPRDARVRAALEVRGAPVDEQGDRRGGRSTPRWCSHAGAPVPDRGRAVARAPRRADRVGARTAGWSSRTTTTPSSATTARRSPRCRVWRPITSSTWARSRRRSRRACGSAGWCCRRR